MMEVYLDGEALRDSSLKAVPGGHVIINQAAFYNAGQMRMQALDRILKGLDKARSLAVSKKLLELVFAHARRALPREAAAALAREVHEKVKTIDLKAWPTAMLDDR